MINKVTIIGAGYVGMSLALLASKYTKVALFDIDDSKTDAINIGALNLNEDYADKNLSNIKAYSSLLEALEGTAIVLICVNTDYDEKNESFDTSAIDATIDNIHQSKIQPLIVIKSTIPIGYTKTQNDRFKTLNIIFSPEFLREGSAIKDNLNPRRIVIGKPDHQIDHQTYEDFLNQITENDAPIYNMHSSEAEAVKLFSNSYLAMRVAFFNELDNFCIDNQLSTQSIIEAVSADKRIGSFYNNPSFGYGGYCLPKDTKQLSKSFGQTPHKLIQATIESNDGRKEFIANYLRELKEKDIGIYRVNMKEGSDNYREAAILDVIDKLIENGKEIYIYDPLLQEETFRGCKIIKDLDKFKEVSEIIIANRFSDELSNVIEKVFSRDLNFLSY